VSILLSTGLPFEAGSFGLRPRVSTRSALPASIPSMRPIPTKNVLSQLPVDSLGHGRVIDCRQSADGQHAEVPARSVSDLRQARPSRLLLYSNVAEKLTLPLKQDDYLIADLSGQAQADSANRVARLTTTSITGGGA
jgi:hypothetical protein